MWAAWQVLQQVSQHVDVLADSIADVLAAHLRQDVRRRKRERKKGPQQEVPAESGGQSPAAAHVELLSMWKARYPTTWGQYLTEELASLLVDFLNRQRRWQEVVHIFASQVDCGKVCSPPTSPLYVEDVSCATTSNCKL